MQRFLAIVRRVAPALAVTRDISTKSSCGGNELRGAFSPWRLSTWGVQLGEIAPDEARGAEGDDGSRIAESLPLPSLFDHFHGPVDDVQVVEGRLILGGLLVLLGHAAELVQDVDVPVIACNRHAQSKACTALSCKHFSPSLSKSSLTCDVLGLLDPVIPLH